MLRQLLFVIAVLSLGGCANTSAPPVDASFAVVSMLGDELKLKQVGITAFGNAEKFINVQEWNINRRSQDAASSYLEASGKKVRSAPSGAAQAIGTWTFVNFTSTYTFQGGTPAIRNVAAQSGADYLILLTPITGNFGDPFFRTNQSTSGYGVYQRRGGGSIAFADLGILLVDGKTGDVVNRRRSFSSAERATELWIDIENTQPTLSAVASDSSVFQRVINDAVTQGLALIGAAQQR